MVDSHTDNVAANGDADSCFDDNYNDDGSGKQGQISPYKSWVSCLS